jgi:hypothetical protein
MKITKILGVVAFAAMALTAFAGTASATTLENNGTKILTASTIHATLEKGTSAVLSATGGGFANTCTESTVEGTTSSASGSPLSGPISALTFGACKESPVTVDTKGTLTVENISGTTNGTVRSISAKVTTPSPFGSLTCVTSGNEGTDIGTFTGKASGNGTMDIDAVLDCGFFLRSAKWEGKYEVTTGPNGVTA